MNKSRKKVFFKALAACTLSAAMILTSGCGKGKEEKKKIAVITKQQISFWDDVKKGAEAACEELGYEMVYTVASGDNDFSTQQSAIKDAIKDGAEAIVIAPNSDTELDAAYKEAENVGIKLVNINSKSSYQGIKTCVRSSDSDGGAVAARNAFDEIAGNKKELPRLGKIIIIPHTAATAEQRVSGFTDEFKKQYERLEEQLGGTDYTSSDENGDDEQSQETGRDKNKSEDFSKEHYIHGERCSMRDAAKEEAIRQINENSGNISIMYGTNTNTTLGICDAVAELELQDQIVVVGFNSDEEELTYIRTGVLKGTVVQNSYYMGYIGVRYASKLINGNEVPANLDTGVTYVNAKNITQDYIQLMLYPDKN